MSGEMREHYKSRGPQPAHGLASRGPDRARWQFARGRSVSLDGEQRTGGILSDFLRQAKAMLAHDLGRPFRLQTRRKNDLVAAGPESIAAPSAARKRPEPVRIQAAFRRSETGASALIDLLMNWRPGGVAPSLDSRPPVSVVGGRKPARPPKKRPSARPCACNESAAGRRRHRWQRPASDLPCRRRDADADYQSYPPSSANIS
jgi:hypothetical protein